MAVRTLGDGPVSIPVKLPAEVAQAVADAAAVNYETQQSWIRRVIIERLRAEGRLP
jgi:hypothetical protein